MNKYLKASALAFLLLRPAPVNAGEPLRLSLEECLNAARRNNRTLLAAEEEIEAAEKGVLEAMGNFLPSLSASGNYARLDRARTTGIPGAYSGTESRSVSAGLQLPVFTGMRNRSLYRSARAGLESRRENYRRELNELSHKVTEAFYRALLSEKLLELNRESGIRLESHARQTRTLFENGLASRLDLLRAEVQLSNLQPHIIQSENSLRMARASLSLLTGAGGRGVIPEGELYFSRIEADLEPSLTRALSSRPELKMLELRRETAEELLTLARSAGLPQLYASYSHSIDRPFRLQDEWGESWAIMLNLTVPVFRGFSTLAETSRARSGLRRSELSLEDLREAVRLEVENAYYALIQEEKSIGALKKNLEQAGEALEMAQTRYRNGLITNLEFMDTELSYMQAQVNLFRSKADYIIAASRLKQAAGGEYK